MRRKMIMPKGKFPLFVPPLTLSVQDSFLRSRHLTDGNTRKGRKPAQGGNPDCLLLTAFCLLFLRSLLCFYIQESRCVCFCQPFCLLPSSLPHWLKINPSKRCLHI